MLKARQKIRPMAEINVVPYIDVMLVLLVIFMITTPLLTQGVKVNLPKAAAKAIESKQDLPIVLSVNSDGKYFLNVADTPDSPLSKDMIATRVAAELRLAKQKGIERQVLVKGDRYVDYGKVVSAMALLQRAGAKSVGLMTSEAGDEVQ